MAGASLSRSPLLATRHDQELFAGRREELDTLHSHARQRLNTLVLGEVGVGKTSLLQQLLARLEGESEGHGSEDAPFPVWVGGRARDAEDFLLAAAAELMERRRQSAAELTTKPLEVDAVRILPSDALPESRLPRDSVAGMLAVLRAIEREIARIPAPVVFLVDEMNRPEVAYSVFGRMRDELWQLGAAWIVAGRPVDRRVLLEPPADAFFERVLELAPLSRAEAVELLRRRGVELTDRETLELAELSGGHPVTLLMLAQQVAQQSIPVAELREQARRARDAAKALGGPATRLLAELEATGEGRATDPDLQARLGWSPQRLRQVFSQLEKAGVVERVPDKTDRPGRPGWVFLLKMPEGVTR